MDNLSVINGAKVETPDRIFFNSLNITGGELQAENIYQIGMGETDDYSRQLAAGRKLKSVIDNKLIG